jgi:transposase
LKDELLPETEVLIGECLDIKLMHDNAPCHTSRLVKDFLETTHLEFIDWPPYSPDLNPIENIWAYVKYKLYPKFRPAKTKQELIENVFEIWDSIDPDLCKTYCGMYYKRFQAVIAANGLQTKY